MRTLCVLSLLVATAGCATSRPQATQGQAGPQIDFVTVPFNDQAANQRPGAAPFDAGLNAEDAWRGKPAIQVETNDRLETIDRPSFETLRGRLHVLPASNGLDNMPFGTHPFGPWDTGSGLQTP